MKLFNRKLWTALSATFTSAFAVLFAGTFVANFFYTSINAFFQCPTYKVVKAEGNENTDYFPDEWAGFNNWFEAYEQDLCERTEAEGAVLLKNEKNALPLAKGSKVSLFSHSSVDLVYTGTGSGSVDTSTAPNLRKAFNDRGLEVNNDLWAFYNTGAGSAYKRSVPSLDTCTAKGEYKINEVPWSVYTNEVKNTFKQYGDAAIFVLARSGGEGGDLARTTAVDAGTNGDYLALSADEKEVLTQLKALKDAGTIKKIVVLLNSSNAVNCAFLDDAAYGIDACLWMGGPGAYGTNAVADILVGNTNPSGRLADTYLNCNLNGPSVQNFGDCTYKNAAAVGLTDTDDTNATNVNYVVYQEGIYVGYKYYETRYEDVVMGTANVGSFDYDKEVYRTFGYGGSYTTFEYSDFKVKEEGDAFNVSVTVTNTGDVKGKHAVEIYMQKPYSDYDKKNGIEKSAVELVGFEKTAELAPNAKQSVSISVPKELMRSYDANAAKTYILDEGAYYLTVGSDAHHAVNNILSAKGYQTDGDKELAKQVADVKEVDTKIYSKSLVTDEEITNRFDNVDINKYDAISEKVTYLSRSDWAGTYPTGPVQLTATKELAKDVLDEYVPQEGYEMPTFGKSGGLTMAMLMGKEYNDPAWEDLLDQMSFEDMEGLVVYGFHNTKAVASISKPATIETNGPQGITNSFFGGGSPGMAYPAETVMCATWNKEIMAEIGDCIGLQGLKSGTHGVYGPGANIHRNAYCGRNYEYYSEDAFLSGNMMAPEVRAIQSHGVYVFMKHYALNDQETHRGGVMTWANEQTIRETYLAAFEYGVRDGGGKGFMTVMNRVGALWGGAHKGMITDVPRGEWGFDGFIITDYSSSSNYTSVINGIEAGVSLWDGYTYGETNTPKLKDLSNDPYACQLLRTAVKRLLYVQVNSSAMNGISANDKIVSILTWWQSLLIGLDVGFGVLAAGSIAMAVLSKKKKEN